ncbi:methyltransferase [uncultured Campylobacter sp.]|uniref:tRNA1(Val) (adenine(37)-N6)-methyltransferase n=1 Tax=uncultured Campylobacter sp. TaxID=218934 RepID=UPI00260824D9|nr:methyltransferase [uncultured Campylobacter sp.]
MRLYQPKKGYRYTSDTIFLWNFIRSSGVRQADAASQNGSWALGCGAEFKGAADRSFNAQFYAADFAGDEAEFCAEDCAFSKEESYAANHSVGNDRDFGSKGCAELKAEFKMKFQAEFQEKFQSERYKNSDFQNDEAWHALKPDIASGENFKFCDEQIAQPLESKKTHDKDFASKFKDAKARADFAAERLCDGGFAVCDERSLKSALNPRAIYGDVLDVGAGCGILGLLLKRDFKSINLSLLEIQERNLEILRLNSLQNDLPAEILHADFAEFKSKKRFDFIVSNPPFYRERISLSKEPHMALSKSAASLSLRDFVRSANAHLKPGGTLIFCYEAGKLAKICELLGEFRLNLTRLGFVYPDISKPAKLALLQARKNSRSPCEIVLPIYASAHGRRTAQAHAIYKSADLTSVDYE